jgi:hypothetical protein
LNGNGGNETDVTERREGLARPEDHAGLGRYTCRILKASALVPDTMALLSSWDKSVSLEENLRLARQGNILGKSGSFMTAKRCRHRGRRSLSDCSSKNALMGVLSGSRRSTPSPQSSAVARRIAEEFKRFYQRKYQEVPKHQHKRALVLTARKLVRLVFSISLVKDHTANLLTFAY